MKEYRWIKELKKKIEVLKFSIEKNTKEIYILFVIVCSMIVSGYSLGKSCKDFIDILDMRKIISESDDTISKNNDDIINSIVEDTILVADIPMSLEQGYYFKDGLLYNNNNIVSLEKEDRNISFISCKIDNEVLKNIDLIKSNTKKLDLSYSSITDGCINCFPSSVEYLSLRGCRYITNLNGIGDKCPNIKSINLDKVVSLNDLSFIYELGNLEELYIKDCAYLTEDLLNYLKDNDITTNINESDVINVNKIDYIVEKIILPGMSDSEKVKVICLYVLDNFEYDIKTLMESNNMPVEYFLNEGRGVCISYAHLTNVLLNKAGVTSYVLCDDSHAWNMVKLNDMYYYVDTTNMDGSLFNKILLSLFNVSNDYMVDPENEIGSMSNVCDFELMITNGLLQDVISKNSNKDLLEKYGLVLLDGTMSVLSLLYSIMCCWILISYGKLINRSKLICYDIYKDYLDMLDNEVNKNMYGRNEKNKVFCRKYIYKSKNKDR